MLIMLQYAAERQQAVLLRQMRCCKIVLRPPSDNSAGRILGLLITWLANQRSRLRLSSINRRRRPSHSDLVRSHLAIAKGMGF